MFDFVPYSVILKLLGHYLVVLEVGVCLKICFEFNSSMMNIEFFSFNLGSFWVLRPCLNDFWAWLMSENYLEVPLI